MYYIMTVDGWKPWLASHKVCDNHNDLRGVFKDKSLHIAKLENSLRADAYAKHVREYINGDRPKERIFEVFSMPIHGAYGEVL